MKRDFADLCDNIGISMSAVLNAMMRQAVRKQEIKISALDLNGLSPAEASELKRRADEVRAGRAKMYSSIVGRGRLSEDPSVSLTAATFP